MKLKTLFKKIKTVIAKVFNKLESTVKKILPIAITIVDGLKKASENETIDSIVDFILDYVKKKIPGELDDILIDKIRKSIETILPKLLLNLQILKAIEDIDDPNEKRQEFLEAMQIALSDLKFSSDERKQVFWRGFSDLLIIDLSDGKISWSELGGLGQYVYEYEKANNNTN